MPIVSLSQKLQRVEFSSFELDNSVVFEFFNSIPAQDRDRKLKKALYIGVRALIEDSKEDQDRFILSKENRDRFIFPKESLQQEKQ
jgi:hypothetical protein